MSDTDKHIDTYRQEAEELLGVIEDAVLDLEQYPEEREYINQLFRAFHTIKGSGSMFGFNDIADFAHHVETLLDHVRKNTVPVTGPFIDLVLASRDHIKMMLDAASGAIEIDRHITITLITALKSFLPPQKKETAEVVSENASYPSETNDSSEEPSEDSEKYQEMTYRIRFQPHMDIIRTGMEPVLLLNELSQMGECMITAQTESIPLLAKLEPELCYLYWDIMLTTTQSVDDINEVFIFVEQDSRIQIQPIEGYFSENENDTPPRLGEILIERGDTSPEKIREILGSQKRIGELLVESGIVSEDKVISALTEQKALGKWKSRTETGNLRVSSEKLDHLINLVGELVITQAHISQVVSLAEEFEEIKLPAPLEKLKHIIDDLAAPGEILERLTNELRDCALDMRMIPIGSTFGKFRRLIRDLSAELGKEIQLVTEGAETELDKTLIERLNDPLVHLIRNSIDHGIQSPEERISQGKPKAGTIRLAATHKGAKVVISVEDDGMGMDLEHIFAKAVEKGLIPENIKIPDEKIAELILLPGFSTAEHVTSVSGRGVGMDVVKREIDSLGGSIKILTHKGEYLRVQLSLPLTLAIIDGLLIRVADSFFVLPLAQVDECAELDSFIMKKNNDRNMILLRDTLIPFVRLREFFDISGEKADTEHIAIVSLEHTPYGIVTDEIIGNIQTVIKSLDRNCRNAEGISGATIMGDGTVALIIDIPGLIRCARRG